MQAAERREQILERLKEGNGPISATSLAKELGVSRQIIVGDVALLRAADHAIMATPRGYVLEGMTGGSGYRFTVACKHSDRQLYEELYTIVDNGGEVLDVIVDHSVYGQLVGKLQIVSRFDVDQFVTLLQKSKAVPLSALTGGVHLHTIRCDNEETAQRIIQQLQRRGILYKEG